MTSSDEEQHVRKLLQTIDRVNARDPRLRAAKKWCHERLDELEFQQAIDVIDGFTVAQLDDLLDHVLQIKKRRVES